MRLMTGRIRSATARLAAITAIVVGMVVVTPSHTALAGQSFCNAGAYLNANLGTYQSVPYIFSSQPAVSTQGFVSNANGGSTNGAHIHSFVIQGTGYTSAGVATTAISANVRGWINFQYFC